MKIDVFSRAKKIALFINGKKVAEKKRKKNCWFVFYAKYAHGDITAVAYGNDGAEEARATLLSAKTDTTLTALPENNTVSTNGLCYVRLAFTDASGTVKPLVRGEIQVKVQGGKLLALGNGCPYNERGYFTDKTETYYGEALAIIAPSGKENVRLSAESSYGNAKAEISVV